MTADRWRAVMKKGSVSAEPVVLVEFEIRRAVLVSADSLANFLDMAGHPEFSEITDTVSEWISADVPSEDKIGTSLPWTPLLLSPEGIERFGVLLDACCKDAVVEKVGSPEAGDLAVRMFMVGRPVRIPLGSKAQADRAKAELSTLATDTQAAVDHMTAAAAVKIIPILETILLVLQIINESLELYDRLAEQRKKAELEELKRLKKDAEDFRDMLAECEPVEMDRDMTINLERASSLC